MMSGKKMPCLRVWRQDCLPCIPARYVLALTCCLGFVIFNTLRNNLSVAIVEMVRSTATMAMDGNGSASRMQVWQYQHSQLFLSLSLSFFQTEPTFDWSENEQGMVCHASYHIHIASSRKLASKLASYLSSRYSMISLL